MNKPPSQNGEFVAQSGSMIGGAGFNPLVSITVNATAQPSRTVPAQEIPNWIRTGPHRGLVRKIQKTFAKVLAETGDTKAAKIAVDADKKKLPGLMPSGVFRARGDKNLETYSQILCGDADNLKADQVGVVYEKIASDPHCLFDSVSPSGFGVKFFCRTTGNAEQHERSVAAMAKHFRDTYGIELDPSCKNVERLCFAPDNASDWNPNAVPFDPLPDEPKAERVKSQPVFSTGSGRPQIAERILGAIEWTDDETGFCKCPGEHLHTTPTDAKHCRIKLNGSPTLHCFHGSCAGIRDGVNHELRSQIGKVERQAAPNSKRAKVASEYLGAQAETEPHDIAARLEQVRFNILTPPPLDIAVFTLSNGTPTHTRGNISAITAQAKAGKTALIAALVAAGITPRPDDCDSLGFRALNPDRLPLALLDTEHSPAHNWKEGDSIFRRALLTESDQLHLFRLAGFTLRDLNVALDHLLKERKWHSFFLDGIGDFVADVNDPEECNAFVARLHGLAIEHDTHILTVLHLNPTSETKSRGHLGSQLERKAETNLRIEKKDGVSIVYSDRNRGADIPKDTAPRFLWSDEHKMHVSAETSGNIKRAANLEELREQCREAFSNAAKTALSWTDLVAALLRVPGVKSQRTAERIHKDAKNEGVIVKNTIGKWELSA